MSGSKHKPSVRESASTGTLSWAVALVALQLAICPVLEQPGETPRRLLLALTPLLAAWFLLRRREENSLPKPLLLLFAIPFATLLVAIPVASAAERASVALDALRHAATWIAALGVALTASRSVGRDALDRALGAGATVALLVLGAIGVTEALGLHEGIAVHRPPAATFVNRNVAGQALILLVPLTVAASFSARRASGRWAAAVAASLGVIFLAATRSRGALAAAVLGWGLAVLVALIVNRRGLGTWARRHAAQLGLLGISIVVALLLPVRTSQPLPSVSHAFALTLQGQDTRATRIAMLTNTGALAAEHGVIGVGPGRFPVVYPLYHSSVLDTPGFGLERRPDHPHNDWVEYAAELGIPAALCLVVLLAGAWLRSLNATRLRGDGDAAVWALARAAALGGVLVHAQVSFPLHSVASAFLTWVLVGRAWATARPVWRAPSARRSAVAVASVLVLIALLGAWLESRELAAQRRLFEALVAYRSRDARAVLDNANRAALASHHRRSGTLAAALIFETERDPERSLSRLEPALAADPHNPNLLLQVGARRLKSGAADHALTAFSHAVEILPTLGRAWLGLAMAHDALGDRERATEACTRAVELADIPEAATFCFGNGYLTKRTRSPEGNREGS